MNESDEKAIDYRTILYMIKDSQLVESAIIEINFEFKVEDLCLVDLILLVNNYKHYFKNYKNNSVSQAIAEFILNVLDLDKNLIHLLTPVSNKEILILSFMEGVYDE